MNALLRLGLVDMIKNKFSFFAALLLGFLFYEIAEITVGQSVHDALKFVIGVGCCTLIVLAGWYKDEAIRVIKRSAKTKDK